MRINANHVDMLYRVALAERFTSPTEGAKYDRAKIISELIKAQLVTRATGMPRLTEEGSDVLDQRLDRERGGLLRRVRERGEAYATARAKGAR